MSTRYDLILRNVVTIERGACDVALADGYIAATKARIEAFGPERDCGGNLLLPGLIDHHIHLLATAAKLQSADLSGLVREEAIVRRLREAASKLLPEEPLRATGYDERALAIPGRAELDCWVADRPLRVQDRTGALWLLNSRAVAQLGNPPWPDCVETDDSGEPTGRIWRGDGWLRERLGSRPPSLAPLAAQLSRLGIIGVTDTGAANGASEAGLFERSRESGQLPQKLQLMGTEDMPEGTGYRRGPLKLLYDERDLPPLDIVADRIRRAREQGRAVAAHCVTEGELSYFLAALDIAGGSRRGDRIEHGSMIPAGAIGEIAKRGLTVVTHPSFVHDRGDRYLETIDDDARQDLYRLASLEAGGVNLAGGSDAPYGSFDPWLAMRSGATRRTVSNRPLGSDEALPPDRILQMYLLPFDLSTGVPRTVSPGAAADLCLFDGTVRDLVHDARAERVLLTLIDGRPVFEQ